MAISPTAEGFRAAFRRPAVTLAEIMWRWTAGATAAALFVFGLFEYLNTLPVTNGELLFLRTRHPYLVGEAIAHIFRGSLNRAVLAGLLAVSMLAVLWIVAASVGRVSPGSRQPRRMGGDQQRTRSCVRPPIGCPPRANPSTAV